ncbi:PHP domain-containing protein [Streptomyces filamentosus]|uniref:PHP domain-containing protein n=1 Tax=Streptomyces filamentosus TaxID=67294 RepID=UPI00123B75CC|nr:PHP domain-containing protein [Streptomyces filamentosus]KAA6210547.1 PHP domain-containing protein [Streptomyces filamentosus]
MTGAEEDGPEPGPLRTDLHAHTDFSDGRDPLGVVVKAAEAAGLTTLVLTDHVRADTTYLPGYVAAVRAAQSSTPVRLVCGVEAKILDTEGRIDLPGDLTGIEHVALADHRFPLPDGPAHPDAVRALLDEGRLAPDEALRLLVLATARAVERVPEGRTAHVAHLFSVLPKTGLDESGVDAELLEPLVRACRAHGTAVELNEKWRCPSVRTARLLHRAGVRLAAGSDAHRAEAVGRFPWVSGALAEATTEAPWTS